MAFAYTNDTMSEKELTGSVPLTITPKSFKCVGMNLIKYVKELYNENF